MARPDFTLGTDTKMLIDKFRETEEGVTITYAELSAYLERDVRKEARSSLNSAIRYLINEGIVMGTVRREGIRRYTTEEIAKGAGIHSLKKINRECKRGIKKLGCVAGKELSNEARIRMNTDISILGMTHECSKPKNVKKLEYKVQNNEAKQLPVAATLEAFKNT